MPPHLDTHPLRYPNLSYSSDFPFSIAYATDIGLEPDITIQTTPSKLEKFVERIVEKKVRELLEEREFILGKLPDKADEKKYEEALGAAQSGEERDEV